jgi:flagellar hook assembly protein FlgD
MIGKEVQADSSSLVLDNGKAAKGSFYLGESADCTVYILNENGVPVRDIKMGVLQPGNIDFEWDGFDNSKKLYKSGQFTYEVKAINIDDENVSVNKFIKGTVTGIDLSDKEPILYVNSTPISMSQIINVNMVKDTES